MADDDCRITRRQALGLLGAGAAGAGIGGYIYRDKIAETAFSTIEGTYRTVKQLYDSDLDGITDQAERSGWFKNRLENIFETEVAPFDPDSKELVIDARYIGDETFSEQNKEYLIDLFEERAGIDLRWMDHPETYDEETFLEEYGYQPSDMLWGVDSFYETAVEDDLKNRALQVIFVPGKPDGDHEGGVYCAAGDKYAAGLSVLNRAVVTGADQRQKLFTTLHEVLHLGNWEHNYDDPNDRGVMGQYEVADATQDQWDRFTDRLHLINLSAPGFVYDQVIEATDCNDISLPDP